MNTSSSSLSSSSSTHLRIGGEGSEYFLLLPLLLSFYSPEDWW